MGIRWHCNALQIINMHTGILQHHELSKNNGLWCCNLLYVKTMVCGVVIHSLEITLILQPARVHRN